MSSDKDSVTNQASQSTSSFPDGELGKKAQGALMGSEKRYRELFDSLPEGLVTIEMVYENNKAVDFRFLEVNNSYARLIGKSSPNEVVGKTTREAIDTLEDYWYQLYDGVFKTGQPVHYENYVKALDEYYEVVAWRTGNNKVAILCYNTTERKKAEEAIRESESKYRLIVDTAEEGIWVATPDGKATYVNQKMADMLGYPKEDILGKAGLEFLEKPQQGDVDRNRKILQDKSKVQAECKFITKDGSILWTIANTAPVFDSQGNHVANIAMHTDITERKKAEEELKNSEQAAVEYANQLEMLKEKLELKTVETEQYATKMESIAKERAKQLQDSERLAAIGATAGMVGHDIRNPLQAMMSDVFILKDLLKSMPHIETKTEVEESLDGLEKNIAYVNKIVADLQDYARQLKPEYTMFDLNKLIDDTLKTVNIPDNIKLSVNTTPGSPIKSDQTYLRRSITNLVNNAIQAMPNGGTIGLTCQTKDGRVLISISDTGVGIPEQVKARLFTPMMTTKAKGQGLGLAVVKRLIEALNGSISFESQEGKGTKFAIELPTNTSA
jgi:PAS domain S-box-containing protein